MLTPYIFPPPPAFTVSQTDGVMSSNSGRLSEGGIAGLKKSEGFKPNIYNDAGNEAIGHGVNLRWFPGIRDRLRGKTRITEEEGDDVLREVLPQYENGIRRIPGSEYLNQNQFDAVVM